jgi:hypothetical protein
VRDRDGWIWQEVQAPDGGTYVLSAYSATDVLPVNVQTAGRYPSVALGVMVDGELVGSPQFVKPYAGYQRYTVTFDARQGSTIRVWYHAPQSAPLPFFGITPDISQPLAYAVLDSVSLTRADTQ